MTTGKYLIGLAGTRADSWALEVLGARYGFLALTFDFPADEGVGWRDDMPCVTDMERWRACYDEFKDTDHIAVICRNEAEAQFIRNLGGVILQLGKGNVERHPADYVRRHKDVCDAIHSFFEAHGLPEHEPWDYEDEEPPTLEALFDDVEDYLQGLEGELFGLLPEGSIDRTIDALHKALDEIKSRVLGLSGETATSTRGGQDQVAEAH